MWPKAVRWGYNGNLKLSFELLHDADMKQFLDYYRRKPESEHCFLLELKRMS